MEEQEQVLTAFYPAAWDGKQLWYCDFYHNVLCQADLEEGHVSLAAPLSLPSGWWHLDRWHGCAAYAAGCVVVAPLAAHDIIVYHVATGKMQSLELPENPFDEKEWGNLFQDAFSWGGCVYLVPGRYNRILKVDPATAQVKELVGDYQAARPFDRLPKNGESGHCVAGNRAYLSFWDDGMMLEIDLGRDEAHILHVAETTHHYSGVSTADGELFWLVARDEPVVVRWDRRTDEAREYRVDVPMEGLEDGFRFLLDGGTHLWLLPTRGDAIVRMEKATGCMKAAVPLSLDEVPTPAPSVKCNFLSADPLGDGRAVLSDVFAGAIVVFDLATGEHRAFPSIVTDTDDIRGMHRYALQRRWNPEECQMYAEQPRYPFPAFLSLVGEDAWAEAAKEKTQESAGEAIYQHLAKAQQG